MSDSHNASTIESQDEVKGPKVLVISTAASFRLNERHMLVLRAGGVKGVPVAVHLTDPSVEEVRKAVDNGALGVVWHDPSPRRHHHVIRDLMISDNPLPDSVLMVAAWPVSREGGLVYGTLKRGKVPQRSSYGYPLFDEIHLEEVA